MEYYQQTAREVFAAQASGPEGLLPTAAGSRLSIQILMMQKCEKN